MMRVLTAVIAAAVASIFAAPSAQAAPLSMTFTEARANVGVQLSDAALFAAPDTAPFAAEIDAGTGEITAGSIDVPDFSTHITDPIDADVLVESDPWAIVGSFDSATGGLTSSVTAGWRLTANGRQCTVATVPSPLTLTTTGSSGGANPRSGTSFTDGLDGDGAIAGQWTDMTATAVNPGDPDNVAFCNNVQGEIGGPGGIWLEQDAPEPAPPVCSATSAETAFETPIQLALACTGVDRVISIADAPTHGTLGSIDQTTGKVIYTPDAGFSGTDAFTFEATNSGGTSSEATAAIQVGQKPSEAGGAGAPPAKPKRKCRHKKKLKRGRCVKKKKKRGGRK